MFERMKKKILTRGALICMAAAIFIMVGEMNASAYSIYNFDNWLYSENTGTTTADSLNLHSTVPDDNYFNGTFDATYPPSWFTESSPSKTGLEFSGGGQYSMGDHLTYGTHDHFDLDWTWAGNKDGFQLFTYVKCVTVSGYRCILDHYYYDSGTGRAYGYTLYINDGDARFSIYGGAGTNYNVQVSGNDIPTNTWVAIKAYYNDTTDKLWVGWTSGSTWYYAETTASNGPAEYTSDLETTVGVRHSGWGGYMPFDGKIDELKIYYID